MIDVRLDCEHNATLTAQDGLVTIGSLVRCQEGCEGLHRVTRTITRVEDPAFRLLLDDFTTTPVVYREGCYICNDSEFAQMGLPLCYLCPKCKTGHIAADDTVCDDCGYEVTPEDYGAPPRS